MDKPFLFLQGEVPEGICSFCGEPLGQFNGNYAFPLTNDPSERACDDCNRQYVIPARLDVEFQDFQSTLDELIECIKNQPYETQRIWEKNVIDCINQLHH